LYERHVGHIDRVTDSHRPFVYMKGNRCIIGGGVLRGRAGGGRGIEFGNRVCVASVMRMRTERVRQ
jgi:hypothetical protein